jgi:hypothetical protein
LRVASQIHRRLLPMQRPIGFRRPPSRLRLGQRRGPSQNCSFVHGLSTNGYVACRGMRRISRHVTARHLPRGKAEGWFWTSTRPLIECQRDLDAVCSYPCRVKPLSARAILAVATASWLKRLAICLPGRASVPTSKPSTCPTSWHSGGSFEASRVVGGPIPDLPTERCPELVSDAQRATIPRPVMTGCLMRTMARSTSATARMILKRPHRVGLQITIWCTQSSLAGISATCIICTCLMAATREAPANFRRAILLSPWPCCWGAGDVGRIPDQSTYRLDLASCL